MAKTQIIEPENPEQWREAADAASLWTLIEAGRKYGCVKGVFTVDLEKCHQLIDQAREQGIESQFNV